MPFPSILSYLLVALKEAETANVARLRAFYYPIGGRLGQNILTEHQKSLFSQRNKFRKTIITKTLTTVKL